jgi:hypothetical protein
MPNYSLRKRGARLSRHLHFSRPIRPGTSSTSSLILAVRLFVDLWSGSYSPPVVGPQFVFDLSRMDGLYSSGSTAALQRLSVIVKSLHAYLAHLYTAGHHVIHSTPMFSLEDKSTLGLTSVAFQILSKTVVTRESVGRRHQAPVILVCGMNQGRPLPSTRIEWSDEFITRSKRTSSYSKLCLSNDAFLSGYLMPLLTKINARTTIISRSTHVDDDDDDMRVSLTMWGERRLRKRRGCNWTLKTPSRPDVLEFIWAHSSNRTVGNQVQGDDAIDDSFSVSCEHQDDYFGHALTQLLRAAGDTQNQLLIPTIYRPGCLEITVRGDVMLRLEGAEDGLRWK